jgi:hypothetical protein
MVSAAAVRMGRTVTVLTSIPSLAISVCVEPGAVVNLPANALSPRKALSKPR